MSGITSICLYKGGDTRMRREKGGGVKRLIDCRSCNLGREYNVTIAITLKESQAARVFVASYLLDYRVGVGVRVSHWSLINVWLCIIGSGTLSRYWD
jgi:hypothetical protein